MALQSPEPIKLLATILMRLMQTAHGLPMMPKQIQLPLQVSVIS